MFNENVPTNIFKKKYHFFSQKLQLMLRMLDYHFKNTDNAVTTTLIRQSHNIFPDMISDCLGKWMNQFRNFEYFRVRDVNVTHVSNNLQGIKNVIDVR